MIVQFEHFRLLSSDQLHLIHQGHKLTRIFGWPSELLKSLAVAETPLATELRAFMTATQLFVTWLTARKHVVWKAIFNISESSAKYDSMSLTHDT